VNVAQVLEAAADWIETHEKCERTRSLGMKRCALGALYSVTVHPFTVENAALYMASRRPLEKKVGGNIAVWSDSHSAREVVATLRAVAHEEGQE